MGKEIQVTRSSMPDFDEYIEEIRGLWASHWLTNMGEKHNELEQNLLEYLEVDNISLFTNGHLALEAIIQAFELTGEVITTPYTFASTTTAILRNGLEPIFCDINEEDYTIDVTKIEELITDKTTAIIPVHVYGNICDVEAIEAIAKKHDLKVIYDAAHTFGEKMNGISVGNFGDASMFSFHATKVFNTIEGGAITFKDEALADRLNAQKNFGMTGTDTYEYVGGNAKMNEFQAAMGLVNLKSVDNEIAKREVVYKRYIDNLKNVEGISLPMVQEGLKPNYSYFPVIFEGYKSNRNEMFSKLRENKITARKYFYPLMTNLQFFEDKYKQLELPVAESISEKVLTLPLYADLSLEDVDRICEIILK